MSPLFQGIIILTLRMYFNIRILVPVPCAQEQHSAVQLRPYHHGSDDVMEVGLIKNSEVSAYIEDVVTGVSATISLLK